MKKIRPKPRKCPVCNVAWLPPYQHICVDCRVRKRLDDFDERIEDVDRRLSTLDNSVSEIQMLLKTFVGGSNG